jgi:hypothetical protein
MIHHLRGEYGNTLKFLDRAVNVLRGESNTDGQNLVDLLRFEVSQDLNLADTHQRYRDLKQQIELESRKYLVGYFLLLQGYYFCRLGRLDEAAGSFASALEQFNATGQRDDEARSLLSLARVALDRGDRSGYEGFAQRFKDLIRHVESKGLVAEYELLELTATLDPELRRAKAEQCDVLQADLMEAIRSIEGNALLFHVWRGLSDNDRAERAFGRFYGNVKKMLSGLPSDEMREAFLARADISDVFRQYRDG